MCAHVDVRRGGGRREDMSENKGDGWGKHLRGGCKHSKSIKTQLLQAKPGFITNQSGARQDLHASISSPEKWRQYYLYQIVLGRSNKKTGTDMCMYMYKSIHFSYKWLSSIQTPVFGASKEKHWFIRFWMRIRKAPAIAHGIQPFYWTALACSRTRYQEWQN